MNDLLLEKNKILYKKLFDIVDNINSISIAEWSVMHSLAYLMVKYKERFGQDFLLTYKGSPSKCYEYKGLSRLWQILKVKSGDALVVKNYIDWFMDNYKGKNRFRSVGALVKVELVIEYNNCKQKENQITLYTPLPEKVLSVLKKSSDDNIASCSTFGDLYFIWKSSLGLDNDDSFSVSVREIIYFLVKEGFSMEALEALQ